MTTGTKIQALRKENKDTQESLAIKLDVSRQSVSKWESDLSFPETNKLIELARLYNVSIDYLLLKDDIVVSNDTNEEESSVETEVVNVKNQNTKKIISKKNLFASIFTILSGAISLLLYNITILHVPVETPMVNSFFDNSTNSFFNDANSSFFGTNTTNIIAYLKFDLYDVAFTGSTDFGNVMSLLTFVGSIVLILLGIIYMFYPSKKLNIGIKCTFVSEIIFTVCTAITWSNIFAIGLAVNIVYFVVLFLLFVIVKRNKFVEEN